MAKFSFNMTDAEIAAGSKSIGTRSKTLRTDTHKIMVSIIVRWAKSGDAKTGAQQASVLLSHVDGYTKQAVINWFGEYVGLAYDKDTEAFSYTETKVTIDVSKGDIFINGSDVKAKTFWEFTPPTKAKPYDSLASLTQFLDTAGKKLEKPGKNDNVDEELVNEVRAAWRRASERRAKAA